jgi:UDP-N-acetyl-2-amino-2-deoxyglucuronate dehydrogenase
MRPIGLAIWRLHHQHPPWYRTLLEGMPQYELRCVCDSDAEFVAERAAAFDVEGCDDPGRMLGREDIELVFVLVPHADMPDAAVRCIAAGKHVLVEKPMGTSAADVRRIVVAAEAADVVATTAFYFRYHPVAAKIRQWIADGLLGRVTHLGGRMVGGSAARYVRDRAAWMLDDRHRGGPVFNYGVHWIDLFRHLTGLEVRAVQGVVNRFGGAPQRTIEDAGIALLEYDNGAVGVLNVSYGLPPSYPGHRDFFIALRGTLGCLQWQVGYGPADDEVLLVSEHASVGDRKAERIRVPMNPVSGYGSQMGRDFMANLAKSIREARPLAVTATDGLRALAVAEAVRQSADRKERIAL